MAFSAMATVASGNAAIFTKANATRARDLYKLTQKESTFEY